MISGSGQIVNLIFHMRVEPLGTNQGLASGSGSYYPIGPAAGLLLLSLTLYGDRTSEV